ncbi:hypothetical protein RIF29_39381 [Crotalaria pallida]|uniref:Uncharacterized protein n=1 Tax=Crotalaria pallida TaxID=3830 RepID=A0AAN9E3J2_CROPI
MMKKKKKDKIPCTVGHGLVSFGCVLLLCSTLFEDEEEGEILSQKHETRKKKKIMHIPIFLSKLSWTEFGRKRITTLVINATE